MPVPDLRLAHVDPHQPLPVDAALASSAWRRTVGTAVPAPSSITAGVSGGGARPGPVLGGRRVGVRTRHPTTPSPNIRMFGRATAPHRGHTGSGGTARIVASSIPTTTSSAGQVPSWQGTEHCSAPIAPWHSVTVSGANPAAWNAPSTFEVNTRVGRRRDQPSSTAKPGCGVCRAVEREPVPVEAPGELGTSSKCAGSASSSKRRPSRR